MSKWKEIAIKKIVLDHRPVTYGIVQPGPDIRPDGIPLIRGRDYSSGKVNTTDLYHVKPEIDLPYKRSKVLANDILFSIAGYVGQVAVVPESLAGANITQTTARISVDINTYNSQYIFYYLVSEFTQIQVRKYAKGSAQEGLNLSDVEKIELKFPSLPAQRKIAQILSTTDAVIEKTLAAIAKYKAIKQGMLHDLFTRGIDIKTGKLRPKQEDAPDLYKESELGWIPKEWDVITIEEFASDEKNAIVDGPFGSNLKTIHYRSSGVPVIQSGFVTSNKFIAEKYLYVDKEKFESEIRSKTVPGDIIMAKIGAQCGTCAILPNNHPIGILAGNSLKITVSKINSNEFLEAYLHFMYETGLIYNIISTTAQPAVSMSSLKVLKIKYPNPVEQKEIAKRLKTVDNKLISEQTYLQKLQQIKSGLMADLLSGKKLVTITEELETQTN